jgi:hypothetical protein
VAIVVVAKVDVDVAATATSVKQAMEVLDATIPGEAAATTQGCVPGLPQNWPHRRSVLAQV